MRSLNMTVLLNPIIKNDSSIQGWVFSSGYVMLTLHGGPINVSNVHSFIFHNLFILVMDLVDQEHRA